MAKRAKAKMAESGSLEAIQAMPCYGPPLGYMQWHADADRRDKRGERQVYCGLCNIWAWPSNVRADHKEHTMEPREFWISAKRMQAQLDKERRVADRAVDGFRRLARQKGRR